MNLTKIQMESYGKYEHRVDIYLCIDKIILFLKTDKDLRCIFNEFIMSDVSRVKILNFLTHVFNIITDDETLEYRIYKGNYTLIKYSEKLSISGPIFLDGTLIHEPQITEYPTIDICNICDSLIDKSYKNIYKILCYSFK